MSETLFRRRRIAPTALPSGSDGRAVTGLYVLTVLTFGAYLPSSLYPGYQQNFQADDLTMTLIYAVFALVSAPALLLLGSASDALGARPVLRAGLAMAALGSTCFAVAPGVEWLIAGRAAQGLALGAATSAAAVLVSEGDRTPQRGAVRAGIGFVAGTASGATVGGFLAEYAPAPYLLPFVLHLCLLAGGWYLVSALPPLRGGFRRARQWRVTLPRIPGGMRWAFAAASAVGFLAWTAAGLFLAVIPALLSRSGTSNMAVTGCVLGAVLVCSALTQPLVARVGPRLGRLAGLGLLFVGFALLAVPAGGSVAGTLAAAVIAGAGHGLAHTGAAASVEARAPAGDRGAITGALYLAFYLGSGLPAVAVGLLTLRYPLATATSAIAGLAGALALLTGLLVHVTDRPAPGSSGTVVRRRIRVRGSRVPSAAGPSHRAGACREDHRC